MYREELIVVLYRGNRERRGDVRSYDSVTPEEFWAAVDAFLQRKGEMPATDDDRLVYTMTRPSKVGRWIMRDRATAAGVKMDQAA
jgi:hypothetical protein